MKPKNQILLLVMVLIIALGFSARAALDNDVFSTVRTVVIGTPGFQAAAAPILNTNGPVDILGFGGRGQIIVTTGTNAGGAVTVTLENSPDSTNWTQVANFALINSTTSVSITNSYPSGANTNLIVTDSYLLPFTTTTPTAATAGFATPYSAMNLFTNAAGAVTVTAKGTYIIGVNLTDMQRYIHVIISCTGAATNGNTYVSTLLQGNRYYQP